jgi:hypothetical protein
MIKQLIRTSITSFAAVCTLAACTSLHVKYDVNSELIQSVHCRTFAWAGSFHGGSPLRQSIANPVNEERLRNAIAVRMQANGIQPVTGDADCLVGYGIGANTVVEGAYPVGWGWGYPYGPGWYGYGGPYVYHEGVIGIDVYDARSRKPLWHATVNQSLHGTSGAEAEKRINRAVDAIFAKHPI